MISIGRNWQINRHFAIRVLKDFGFGKSILEDTVNIEVRKFLKILKQNANRPFKMDYVINVAAMNIIWGLVAGKYKGQIKELSLQVFPTLTQNFKLTKCDLSLCKITDNPLKTTS